MNILVNIECQLGLPEPKEHMCWLSSTLSVKDDDVQQFKKYNGAWFYTINDVKREKYNGTISKIEGHFKDLYNKGLIQYFYIGEFDF